jgi:hypothetical protein
MISTNNAIDIERLRPDYLYRLSILLRPARPDFLCYLGLFPAKRIWRDPRHHRLHSCIISLLGFLVARRYFSAIGLMLGTETKSHNIPLEHPRLYLHQKAASWVGTLDGVAVLHRLRYPSFTPTTNESANMHTFFTFVNTVEYTNYSLFLATDFLPVAALRHSYSTCLYKINYNHTQIHVLNTETLYRTRSLTSGCNHITTHRTILQRLITCTGMPDQIRYFSHTIPSSFKVPER